MKRLKELWHRFDDWMEHSWIGNFIVVFLMFVFFYLLWIVTPD